MAETTSNDDLGEIDLTASERADIDGMYLRIATSNLYELLAVAVTADRRTIRDAYFELSKKFHPDAYFGKKLGPYKARIEAVFREITRAYDTLSNRNLRAEYDASLSVRATTAQVSSELLSPVSPSDPPPNSSPPSAAGNPSRSRSAPQALGTSTQPQASDTGTGLRAKSPAPPSLDTLASKAQPTVPDPSGVPLATVTDNRPVVPPPVRPSVTNRQDVKPPVSAPSGVPHVDAEAARRAAREALARKLGGPQRTASGSMSMVGSARAPQGVPSTSRLAGALPISSGSGTMPDGSAGASPLESFEALRRTRNEAERQAKLASLKQTAEAALRSGNLFGASNALSIAASLAPEDLALRARADEIAQKLAESLVDRYVEQARHEERTEAWAAAAESWQKAWLGRRHDASMLDRAALALLRAGTDYRKAAELARRATQIAPDQAKYYITLARVFLAAGHRASARSALETASKLDPTSPDVKDLLQKAKG